MKYVIYQLANNRSSQSYPLISRTKKIDLTIDDQQYDKIFIYDTRLDFLDKLGSRKEKLQNQIEYLLQYQELFPTVKLLSQQLLLLLNPNKEKYIYDLLNCLSHVQIENLVDQRNLLDSFLSNPPLFLFASRLQINQEKEAFDKLLPFLRYEKQVEIAEQIESTIDNSLKFLEKEKIANFLKSISYEIGVYDFFQILFLLLIKWE